MTEKISSLSTVELQTILDTTGSIRHALEVIGIQDCSLTYYYRCLNKRIKKDGLSLETNRANKGRRSLQKPLDELLVKNGTSSNTYKLKKRILKEGLLVDKCAKCGLTSLWNGEPISLHLDHINGDRTDNRLPNLRILCPNCHSQTDTYCGKKNRKEPKRCPDCGCAISRVSAFCRPCSLNHRPQNVDIPTEELTRLVIEERMPFSRIGVKYGISGRAIAKKCKRLGIVRPG